MPQTPTPGTTFVVWLIVLVAIGFVLMVLFKMAVWWGEKHPMSNDEAEPAPHAPVYRGGSASAADAARARLHQAALEIAPEYAPPPEPVSLHMSRDAEIAWLTVQRNDDGSYRHSANKIAAFMGGTEAVVKAQVAAIRAKKEPDAPPPSPRLDRPPQGWPSKAS